MARKQPEERPEWETSNVALLLFTSLMIILLAFFIMLSSMAVIDEQRKIEAWGSLLGAFGILPGGLGTDLEERSHIAPPTTPIDIVQAEMEQIREVLSARVIENQIRFLSGRTRRIISLNEAVLFPPDGVEILPEMKPLLAEIGNILKNSDHPIIIEGHTDDQPPQNESLKDNWHVSGARALNIMRFFIEEVGLVPERFSAFGYAETKPLAANNSPRNRARNRRIDLILDQSHKMQLLKAEERQNRPRYFDFRGFTFRLFGEGEAP